MESGPLYGVGAGTYVLSGLWTVSKSICEDKLNEEGKEETSEETGRKLSNNTFLKVFKLDLISLS
jgi:hypothetical protein